MLSDNTPIKEYTGNGVTVAFSFPYKFFSADHVSVYRKTISTGAIVTVNSSEYTVSGAGAEGGGTFTFLIAPTSDHFITLLLDSVPLNQEADYVALEGFPADAHEAQQDKVIMILQQQREELKRCPQVLPGSGITGAQYLTTIQQAVTDAQTAQANAETAETNAETAETNAETAQGLAEAARDAAIAAKTAAETAETNAETAETNAETAQTAAEAARDLAQTYASALTANSTTFGTIGTGTKTFSIPTGKQFTVGMWMFVVDSGNAANWMFGQVTAYSGPSISINSTITGGSGDSSSWSLSMCGVRGATGPAGADSTVPGPTGPAGDGLFNSSPILAKTGTYTLVSGDREKLVTLSGTFTVTLPAIVDGYVYKLTNIGAGTITIAPNGAETSEVTSLAAGASVILIGDLAATKWRSLAKDAGGGASATELSFVNGDLTAGVLTVTHNKALSAGYTALVTVVNNSGAVVIPDQINTFATNSFKVDLSSYGTLTGTWYCIYITK